MFRTGEATRCTSLRPAGTQLNRLGVLRANMRSPSAPVSRATRGSNFMDCLAGSQTSKDLVLVYTPAIASWARNDASNEPYGANYTLAGFRYGDATLLISARGFSFNRMLLIKRCETRYGQLSH